MSALVLLLAFKGLAWSVSLAGFRGGPTFPGLLLGVAAGLLATHLPGFATTPAVAVGMGAAMAAVLQLPLAAVVLATLLTAHAGAGVEPLIILGVVVAYLASDGAAPAARIRATMGARRGRAARGRRAARRPSRGRAGRAAPR